MGISVLFLDLNWHYKRVKVKLDSGISAWVYIHVMNAYDKFES